MVVKTIDYILSCLKGKKKKRKKLRVHFKKNQPQTPN